MSDCLGNDPARRWREVDAVFRGALDQPVSARRGFLARSCRDDPELREEVESLLKAVDDSGPFLERCIEDVVDLPWEEIFTQTQAIWQPSPPQDTIFDRSGERLGPYRLIQRIGRGGMAMVYLAERADGQWEQKVAVKILRRGLDTQADVRRFRGERQILSSLDHPNVARLLDGGNTPDGLPYLVMEYVEGTPITRYCDQHRLPIDQRLVLFRDVGKVVQRAHRSLVVHQDLKPSNIMVDKDGRVRLLDFGIAKLMVDAADEEAVRTGIWALTPAYASPEQARREPITTASDIYQLGLLLCVLLAGRRPYDVDGLSPARAERAITEAIPTPPSSLVTEQAARNRSATAGQLRRSLQGDLDTIVLHALSKEPDRRYDSASAMVEDVERFLRGEPVSARPDTLVYRARKFAQRHKTGVITGGIVAALMVASSLVSLQQARLAQAERDRAQAEAVRAEQVTGFVSDLFRAADPDESGDQSITPKELLAAGVVRADSQLSGQPAAHADVLSSIGTMYSRLGSFTEAQRLFERVVVLRQQSDHEPAELAEALGRLAQTVVRRDRARAVSLMEEALAIGESEFPPNDPRLASILTGFAEVLGTAEPEARERRWSLIDRAVAILRRQKESIESRTELASALHASAVGRGPEEGLPLLRESLALRREIYGESHSLVAATLHDMGLMLQTVDPFAADSLLELAVSIQTRIHPPDHARTLNMLNSVAGRFRDRGEYQQAEGLYREILDRRRQAYPLDSLGHAYPMHGLGWVLSEQGEGGEAEDLLRDVLQILGGAGDDLESVRYQIARSTLGRALSVQGRYEEAEPLLRESYSWMAEAYPDDRAYLPVLLERLVDLYGAWGKDDLFGQYRADLRAFDAQSES